MKQKNSAGYRRIGLTGGIGSGKTTAAKRFAELGAKVYSADDIARRALDPGTSCYDRVVSAFGESILLPDGAIDRKRLARIVFSDESKRTLLNGILHPYVIDRLFSDADQDFQAENFRIAVFDIPLLFESGLDAQMDTTIVVASDTETRIRRVIERDGISREQALQRILVQMPDEEKRLRANYVLDNDGSKDDLCRRVDALYELLRPEESNV
ncbi:MAG: dephospho-CoA kinase [Eubacteriales bacterium]|nr:dephospho-CoA kinase [Eubacteriales bacterium]